MWFRYLRIAWSVVFGIVCLLLIVLWVRSYWRRMAVKHFDTAAVYTTFFVNRGVAAHTRMDMGWNKGPWVIRDGDGSLTSATSPTGWTFQSVPSIDQTSNFEWNFHDHGHIVAAPIWTLALPFAAVTAVPWIRWRFGLRSLLIAMTLFAVLLGLAIYAVRK
jgi:hypothetical protein